MAWRAAATRGMTRVMGSTGMVLGSEALAPAVRRVVWEQPGGLDWTPGDKVKIDVGDGQMRSYTPSRVTGERVEVVVHVHGGGAGSTWAEHLEPGDEVRFMGPAKSFPAPKAEVPWAVFVGDETALGLAQALRESGRAGMVMGAVELGVDALGAANAMDLGMMEVARGVAHGDALANYLQTLVLPAGDGEFWLSGEASSVLMAREVLMERGVQTSRMRIKPYWSTRGKAHRKQLERTVLR